MSTEAKSGSATSTKRVAPLLSDRLLNPCKGKLSSPQEARMQLAGTTCHNRRSSTMFRRQRRIRYASMRFASFCGDSRTPTKTQSPLSAVSSSGGTCQGHHSTAKRPSKRQARTKRRHREADASKAASIEQKIQNVGQAQEWIREEKEDRKTMKHREVLYSHVNCSDKKNGKMLTAKEAI